MTRPNARFALSDDDAPVAAPQSLFPSGAELLLGQISAAAADGQVACTMMEKAKTAGDVGAMRAAAAQLVAALRCDPKALARKLAAIIDGVRT